MADGIRKISIRGFKSIRELKDFELRSLNVIIGANGAGKSNFIQIFRMLMAMVRKGFIRFIREKGGADNFLHNGPKVTSSIIGEFTFRSPAGMAEDRQNSYKFELTPTVEETFVISEWRRYLDGAWRSYGQASDESCLVEEKNEKSSEGFHNGVGYDVYQAISNWMVYHFHDTSAFAPMRRSEIVEDNAKLRSNASNIAPFLLRLRNESPNFYQEIVNTIRLVIPFFNDFNLAVIKSGDRDKVRLGWYQKGSDFPMQPYHLSDGSIRFICLATALLQPVPPSTIVIDEPELGLYPEALSLLAELVRSAAKQTQVILATQSPALVNCFSIEDIIVVSRKDGASVFSRLKEKDFSVWLEDYSVGDLWQKNVIAGGITHE